MSTFIFSVIGLCMINWIIGLNLSFTTICITVLILMFLKFLGKSRKDKDISILIQENTYNDIINVTENYTQVNTNTLHYDNNRFLEN